MESHKLKTILDTEIKNSYPRYIMNIYYINNKNQLVVKSHEKFDRNGNVHGQQLHTKMCQDANRHRGDHHNKEILLSPVELTSNGCILSGTGEDVGGREPSPSPISTAILQNKWLLQNSQNTQTLCLSVSISWTLS